jgi:hypothetical protein
VSTPAEKPRWYFAQGRIPIGPVDLVTLQQRIGNAGTLVWTKGMATWQRAESVLGARAALANAPTPSAPAADPRAFDSVWFFARHSRILGPFDFVALRTLARAGKLAPEDRVWRSGTTEWQRAHLVPELFPKRKRAWLARASKQLASARAALRNRWAFWLAIYVPLGAAASEPWLLERGAAPVSTAVLLALALLATCVLVRTAWSALDDERRELEPSRAALGLALPIFQLYWLFRVGPGFADAHNAYVRRHELPNADLRRGPLLLVALATPLLAAVAFVWPALALPAVSVHALFGTLALWRTWDALETLELGKFVAKLDR